MAVAPHIHPTETTEEEKQERISHLLAREVQIALEIIIVVSLIATVVVMSTFYMFAIIPATIVLVSYGLLMLANSIERRTRTEREIAARKLRPTEVKGEETIHEDHSVEAHAPDVPLESALRRRLARVGIECVAGAAFLALALAFTVLDWKLVTLGVFVLFVYILLVTTPVWLAWLEDDLDEETRHQEHVTKG